jgi:hypothetical protein
LPIIMHDGLPVAQTMLSFWQDPASLQSDPAAQPTHAPLSQTAPASQLDPFVAGPVGVHRGAPPSQSVTPCWQVFAVHGAPGVHAPASPASPVGGASPAGPSPCPASPAEPS